MADSWTEVKVAALEARVAALEVKVAVKEPEPKSPVKRTAK